jgi:hypothetical protein
MILSNLFRISLWTNLITVMRKENGPKGDSPHLIDTERLVIAPCVSLENENAFASFEENDYVDTNANERNFARVC